MFLDAILVPPAKKHWLSEAAMRRRLVNYFKQWNSKTNPKTWTVLEKNVLNMV